MQCKQHKQHNWFAFLILLLGIGLMLYAGGRFIRKDEVYREGNSIYDSLSGQVRGHTAAGDRSNEAPRFGVEAQTAAADSFRLGSATQTEIVASPAALAAEGALADINTPGIDFAALKTINSDAMAWLYCPDTVIDYPVMKADDYDYYLNHLPDGTQNANGALFIDYNNASDFSDQLTVIYGHHMKSGRMFGGLKGYKDQKYYEEHPSMYLYTEHQDFRIDLIYGCVIAAGQWREQAFMYRENLAALLDYAAHNTTFLSGATYAEGDRVVALSTCSYEFDDARYVVLGVLSPI